MPDPREQMMTRPVRIQLQRKKGWRLPPNTVSVARPTRWGNPFLIIESAEGREACVRLFREWLNQPGPGTHLAACARRDLRGKNLACWCRIDQPCHADVLLQIANE